MVKEGSVVVMESLGTVKVVRLYPSGAGVVQDEDGRQWLVTADMLSTVESGLFSFA